MDKKWRIIYYEKANNTPVQDFIAGLELKARTKVGIRIFYVAIVDKNFLLLHGFKKKKQKTERKEIKIAEERLREYKLRLK